MTTLTLNYVNEKGECVETKTFKPGQNDKMKEEFEKYKKQKIENALPDNRDRTELRIDLSENIFSAGYQAGRNHPIEVSLEEAAKLNFEQGEVKPAAAQYTWEDLPVEWRNHWLTKTKAILSLVPNCVVKE